MIAVMFTGSQKGTTELQYLTLEKLIQDLSPDEACHGLCIGADYQFHQLCRKKDVSLRGYPGDILSKRAEIPESEFSYLASPKNPLVRNRDMVAHITTYPHSEGQLIVCPKEDYEVLRSGTWAAVRAARSYGINIQYIWPSDGALEFRPYGHPNYHSRIRHV
jgi:hypothetical protein